MISKSSEESAARAAKARRNIRIKLANRKKINAARARGMERGFAKAAAKAAQKTDEEFELDEGGMIGRTKPSRELNVSREEKPHLAGKSSLKDKKRAAHKAERAKTGAALGRALKALKGKRGGQ